MVASVAMNAETRKTVTRAPLIAPMPTMVASPTARASGSPAPLLSMLAMTMLTKVTETPADRSMPPVSSTMNAPRRASTPASAMVLT